MFYIIIFLVLGTLALAIIFLAQSYLLGIIVLVLAIGTIWGNLTRKREGKIGELGKTAMIIGFIVLILLTLFLFAVSNR